MRTILRTLLAALLLLALATPQAMASDTYAPYLKDPASLGFTPGLDLFHTVYAQLRERHYGSDTDAKLYAGVANEVRRLLTEAGQPTTGLDAIPRDARMPERIAATWRTKVDRGLLFYAMIRGLLAGTGDPYTVLMTPREYRRLMEQMQSESFGGVGIFIELNQAHELTVIEPVEGTPAERAGLQPGDAIVRIDGKSTAGIGMDAAVTAIRGPQGSKVVLTIRRGGTETTKTLVRANIRVASVSSRVLPSNVGYVKVRVFGERTGAELADAIHKLEAAGVHALVVDVRNNGGGYLNAAVDVCSNFLPGGATVTYLTDRDGVRRDYKALDHLRTHLPVVLLVNGCSASASEITAGCLKDAHAAVLVGTKTFGKGSVQQLYPLPSGAALKITIAHFFTPSGGRINEVGVRPDIHVDMEPWRVGHGDEDLQMRRALDYLRGRATRN